MILVRTGRGKFHSQSITLLQFPPIAPPLGARPLTEQAVNMARSNAGLVHLLNVSWIGGDDPFILWVLDGPKLYQALR